MNEIDIYMSKRGTQNDHPSDLKKQRLSKLLIHIAATKKPKQNFNQQRSLMSIKITYLFYFSVCRSTEVLPSLLYVPYKLSRQYLALT